MSAYSVFGTINTIFIFISLVGIYSQLSKVWQRKRQRINSRPTELLSLNQFTVSYLAYFSFFVYGYSLEPFNHFIVWPRLIASLIVAMILFEIWHDRRTVRTAISLWFVLATLIIALIGLAMVGSIQDESRVISTSIIVMVTVLLAQGYFHQIKLIIDAGDTGAVDLRMSQFILMMDVSTIAFAVTMGVAQGWPLMMLATVSGLTKIVIIYLFYWVKVSPRAKARRASYQKTSSTVLD